MMGNFTKLAVVSIIVSFTGISVDAGQTQKNRVAVIDTGLDIKSDNYKPFLCKDGHKDFTGTGIGDRDGHGTAIVDLIIKNTKTKNFCLVIYKFFTAQVKQSWNRALLNALEEVRKEKIQLANLSLYGQGFIEEEDEYFRKNNFTLFITAAGNDGINIDRNPRYPASYGYQNIWVVGALTPGTNSVNKISNYGQTVVYWEEATATSYATAIKTGKLIEEKFGKTNGLF